MTILYRYLITEFIKPLLYSTAVFGCLVMISEFFRELNFYLENKTSFITVFAYLLLNLPWWAIQVLPVSVLLAVLFSLGQLSRHGEITAIKAAGINLWRVIALFVLCGCVIGLGDIFLREKVIPGTILSAEHIRQEKIQKEKPAVHSEYYNLVVSLPDNARMTIGYLNVAQPCLKQMVIDYYDASFDLIRQIVAQEAVWDASGGWTFKEGVERIFSGGDWTEDYFSTRAYPLAMTPRDFVVVKLRPEQMTTGDYRRYIRQLETLGVPAEKEKIQFHLRWSSAFSHIIVMMIGIPFALGLGSKHGKILSFTFALMFAFVYWGVQAVGQSLGENGVVSPLIAAWLGNVLFGAAGVYLVSKIQK